MTFDTKPSNPGVRFPPPIIFLLGLAVAWLLDTRVRSLPISRDHLRFHQFQHAGLIIVILGLLLVFWGMFTFARAKTAILPMRAASRIVDHGPYRFTRNPMYTGLSIAYIGVSLAHNSVWALILFPFVIAIVRRYVIAREERYLSSAFGDDYADYTRRVRRWI